MALSDILTKAFNEFQTATNIQDPGPPSTGKAGSSGSSRGENPDSPPRTPHRGNFSAFCGEVTAGESKALLYFLQEKWPEIVPSPLDRKTIPLKIHKKRLFIAVAGSSWANEIELQKIKILEKINQLLPDNPITELRFQMMNQGLST